MSAAAYRARSATELIDATFQIFRRNFTQFYTLAAMFYVPLAIIPRFFTPAAGYQPGEVPGAGYFTAFFVFLVLFLILSAIFQTAMYYACSDAYLGHPVDIADVLKRATRRAGSMFFALFLQGLCIGLAFIFLIIPGIYVAVVLFAVPCVTAFENVGGGASLSRAAQLSQGLRGHVFLTMFLVLVIYLVPAAIVALIANALAGGIGHVTVLSQTVSVLGTSLIFPLIPLALTLTYYDARIRKEGYDIELMAQQVGGITSATKPQPA